MLGMPLAELLHYFMKHEVEFSKLLERQIWRTRWVDIRVSRFEYEILTNEAYKFGRASRSISGKINQGSSTPGKETYL